jgi:pilus assembly protein Flp/PilA
MSWWSLARRRRDERGATAVEYGLMVGMIAIVLVAGVATFGISVSELFLIPAGVFDGP